MSSELVLFYRQSHPTDVFYGGEVLGESAIKYEDQIGPMVVHSYEVMLSLLHSF